MKILITNGNPNPENRGFETYLDRLETILTGQGHTVNRVILREMDLRGCNGCFNCWVKTPGECIQSDDGSRLRQAIIQSDYELLASPLQMGFPSALLKTAMDKSIPLLHPYIEVVHGEAHHRRRYARSPRLGLLLQKESDTGDIDLRIIGDIFSRAALNFRTTLECVASIDDPVEKLASAITAPKTGAGIPFDENLAPTTGQSVKPPSRLTVFNGSPRGKKGNTPLLLGHFLRGFESNPGKSSVMYDLNRIHDRAVFQSEFGEAECVLLGFPLYYDSMPGQVKAFIESLEDFKARPDNPPIGFLVQSGFPEALHSRHVERYLENLAARLRSPYLGTMVRGGIEGIQGQPEKVTAGLFDMMYQLGRVFGKTGAFDPALLQRLAGLEKFKAYMLPVFWLLARTPMLNAGWDQQLKQNGAFERRFVRPYSQ